MYFLGQKALIFAEKPDISKIKGDYILKGILSETTYECS